ESQAKSWRSRGRPRWKNRGRLARREEKMKSVLWLAALAIAASLMFVGCENTNSNGNTNGNANTATPLVVVTPTPAPGNSRAEYTEKQASEERERAKQSKETIGDTLDDAWIHTKIVAQLIANANTPERTINVDVVNNVVTLRGTVDTAEGKAAAEKIAKE